MSDSIKSIGDFRQAVTKMVHDWFFFDRADEGALEEATEEIVRSGLHVDQAAEQLRTWFEERLTVDPGVPGPFGGLAQNLISTTLDLVDWAAITREMRMRED